MIRHDFKNMDDDCVYQFNLNKIYLVPSNSILDVGHSPAWNIEEAILAWNNVQLNEDQAEKAAPGETSLYI